MGDTGFSVKWSCPSSDCASTCSQALGKAISLLSVFYANEYTTKTWSGSVSVPASSACDHLHKHSCNSISFWLRHFVISSVSSSTFHILHWKIVIPCHGTCLQVSSRRAGEEKRLPDSSTKLAASSFATTADPLAIIGYHGHWKALKLIEHCIYVKEMLNSNQKSNVLILKW